MTRAYRQTPSHEYQQYTAEDHSPFNLDAVDDPDRRRAVSVVISACAAIDTDNDGTLQAPTIDGDYYAGIVQVKFDDAYRIRLRNGMLVDLDGSAGDALVKLVASTPGRWEQAHDVEEATLDMLRENGMSATGESLADINNYFHLLLPSGWNAQDTIVKLENSPIVERALRIPVAMEADFDLEYVNPGGITGNVAADAYQRYLDPAPDGIDHALRLARRRRSRVRHQHL